MFVYLEKALKQLVIGFQSGVDLNVFFYLIWENGEN